MRDRQEPSTKSDEDARTPLGTAPGESSSGIGNAALRSAVAAVTAEWQESSGTVPSLDVLVQEVARAVDRAGRIEREGNGEGERLHEGASTSTHRRLLDLLRAEVLQHWSRSHPPPDGDEILDLMQGFETVRQAYEPLDVVDFSGQLSSPGGLELTVEFAHDLRSPLTSILFLAETMLQGRAGELADKQRQQLQLIYTAGLLLLSVASDVIELARGSDRLAVKEPVPFSVGQILESVRDMIRPMAEEKMLDIIISSVEPDQRLGHPVPLSRVLLNLTTNALKFTDQGLVEMTASANGPDRVEFCVRDTGEGLDPDALENLFRPFQPGPEMGRHIFSGTGLGLTICRKLIRAMGSELRVESRRGQGTRFFFELELTPVD